MKQTETVRHKVAELRACNQSEREIARAVGVSASTVCRVLKREDVQSLIEAESLEFLQSLPNARRNIQELVDNFPTEVDDLKKKQGYDASKRMLESVGIYPSNNPSNVYLQINQHNNILSPVIQRLLDGEARQYTKEDDSLLCSIEAETIDVEPSSQTVSQTEESEKGDSKV